MAKFIAFYLPQFHPTEINDRNYGCGFTEWTNVAKAQPLFPGHYQPKIPADLGYYDLRLTETRIRQAELAKKFGIYGFCYWHYWFGGGRRELNLPFDEVLRLKEPDFPFCLGWANHDWYKKSWRHDVSDKLLIKQLYSEEDYILHFNSMLAAFQDNRYIKFKDKLVFYIYDYQAIPDIENFIKIWRDLARENGLNDFYFITELDDINSVQDVKLKLMDGFIYNGIRTIHSSQAFLSKVNRYILNRIFKRPFTYSYSESIKAGVPKIQISNLFPMVYPNWDHTPRSGTNGVVLHNATPKKFGKFLDYALSYVEHRDSEEQWVFIKSWNEWGEGNYLEPDIVFGEQFLEEIALRNDSK